MDLKDKAAKYFESNPEKDKVFGTTDGFLFEVERFAAGHAQTLEEGQNEVETFRNVNLLEVEAETVTGTEISYQLTDADKELFETGLVKGNYNALKVLAKNLKIETTDQKAETFINALEEYKTKNLINPDQDNK
jgi:hypothetical protein